MTHHAFHDMQQSVIRSAVFANRMEQQNAGNSGGHLKRNSMPTSPSGAGGFRMETTLHAYLMVGPYSPQNVWYCDNKKCVYTQHGIYRRYQIQNWRSSKFGAKFVLCDGCVRQFEKPKPATHASNISAPNVNVNLDIQGGQAVQMQQAPPAYGQPAQQNEQIAHPTQRASFDLASYRQQASPSPQVIVQQPTTIVENNAAEQKTDIDASLPLPALNEQDLSGRNILKRGWMMKKGDWMKGYKKRYFILKSDQTLNYYESDTSVMIKGTCYLNDVTGVFTKSVQSFEIHTKKRKW
eukprot:CAMPEP_0202694478 /NCGR_PEP_ID=MMETSP1385-20130828/8330_1 /ASSEMBLY_ACC=CAM_ASM_000861 /TAXON_ID=933848 /ORGANISM="Elphidium margaritaceum" /LENGTH=293 /DNA_ID=CAMNT_0049350331 /DNA_START=1 /DNA_END=879 /DNA_ORIENTATION=-